MDMQLNDSNHEEPEWLKELEENYRKIYFNKEDYNRFFANGHSPSNREHQEAHVQQQQQLQINSDNISQANTNTNQAPYDEPISFAPNSAYYETNQNDLQQQQQQYQQQYNYDSEQNYYNPQQQQQQQQNFDNYHQESLLISSDASYNKVAQQPQQQQTEHQPVNLQASQGFQYNNNYTANNAYENSSQPPIDNVSFLLQSN